MQRWIPILAVVLALQIALALGLSRRDSGLASRAPDTPLLALDPTAVDHLRLDGPQSPDASADDNKAVALELVKRDGHWVLPGYFDAPADSRRVDDLVARLAGIKRGLPVATSAEALSRFKVADDDFERRLVLSAGDKSLATIYLGKSPGLRKSDARTAGEQAVYAIELASFDLPTEPQRWLDDALVKADTASLAEIELAADGGEKIVLQRAQAAPNDGAAKAPAQGDTTIVAGKEAPAWQLASPPPDKRLDEAAVKALVAAIDGVRVDQVLGTEAKAVWQQDKPELQVVLKDEKGKSVEWTLSKAEKGEYQVLKASDKPWYVQLKPWTANPLLLAAAPEKLLVAASDAAPSAGASSAAAASAASAASTAAVGHH